ncbi:tRNA pseudouridine synthase B, partial [Dissostichus eleginoides]
CLILSMLLETLYQRPVGVQQIKVAGRRSCQQRIISGKMTGTVRGPETDSSFVQLWADFTAPQTHCLPKEHSKAILRRLGALGAGVCLSLPWRGRGVELQSHTLRANFSSDSLLNTTQ